MIAVDISTQPEGNSANDTLQILLQTFAIMGKSINQHELREADIVVRPSLMGLKSADFSARQRAIDAGRAAMLAALPARFADVLMQLLSRLESSALFTEESCSFSRHDLLDSLQLWLDKAAQTLAAPARS